MLWTIFALLIVAWFIGMLAHLAAPVVHLILLAAAVLFIVNMLWGRRKAV